MKWSGQSTAALVTVVVLTAVCSVSFTEYSCSVVECSKTNIPTMGEKYHNCFSMQNLIRKTLQGKIKYLLENWIMAPLLQDLKWRVYFLPQLDRGYTYTLSKWGGERRNVSSFTTELHLNSAKQLVIILSSAQIMCHLFILLRFQKMRNIFTVLLSRELIV